MRSLLKKMHLVDTSQDPDNMVALCGKTTKKRISDPLLAFGCAECMRRLVENPKTGVTVVHYSMGARDTLACKGKPVQTTDGSTIYACSECAKEMQMALVTALRVISGESPTH